MSKCYTGIGSRDTPRKVCDRMVEASLWLGRHGYTLRSGKARGADEAFQAGVQMIYPIRDNACEIYIPWKGFQGGRSCWDRWDIYNWPYQCFEIASKIHPAWEWCNDTARKLHARNVCQVLGRDLHSPSKFVIYWAKEKDNKVKGGTATAVNLAREHNIPTINMYLDGWNVKLRNVIEEIENV